MGELRWREFLPLHKGGIRLFGKEAKTQGGNSSFVTFYSKMCEQHLKVSVISVALQSPPLLTYRYMYDPQ